MINQWPNKSLQATRDGVSSSASRFTLVGPACLSSGRYTAPGGRYLLFRKSSVASTMRRHEQLSSALQHAFSASKSQSGCGITSVPEPTRVTAFSLVFFDLVVLIKFSRGSSRTVRPQTSRFYERQTNQGHKNRNLKLRRHTEKLR